MKFNIIKLRPIWYLLSGILVIGSIILLFSPGLKQGIDFTGGSQITLRFDHRPSSISVEKVLVPLKLGGITIQPVGSTDMNIRTKTLDGDTHVKVVKTLSKAYSNVTELEYNAIGPIIGKEMRQNSAKALFLLFFAILAYIAWMFRKVSAPVQSWKYGVVVILTALHDVAIPVGLFVLMGHYANVEIGAPFIAAILTIMGYSINDTIVVLDRTRENLQKTTGTFPEIVERSLHQTILRSFNTSMTTVLSLLAVYFFGGASIRDFALALIVGIITGTYSSIFIASPLLVTWNKWSHRKSR